MLGRWIDVEDPPGEVDPAVEVAGFDVVIDCSLDDFEVRGVKPIAVRRRPLFVLEIEREPPSVCLDQRV